RGEDRGLLGRTVDRGSAGKRQSMAATGGRSRHENEPAAVALDERHALEAECSIVARDGNGGEDGACGGLCAAERRARAVAGATDRVCAVTYRDVAGRIDIRPGPCIVTDEDVPADDGCAT